MLLLGIFLSYIVLLAQRSPSYKAWDPQYVGSSHSAVGVPQAWPSIHGSTYRLGDLYMTV